MAQSNAAASNAQVLISDNQELILIHSTITPEWLLTNKKYIHIDKAYQRFYHKWLDYKFLSYIDGIYTGFGLKDQMIILDVNVALDQEKNSTNPSVEFIDYLEGLVAKKQRYVMVDGQHRSTSIWEYIDGENPFKKDHNVRLNNTDYNLNKPFKEYSVEPKEYFLNQPLSVTFVVKASLPLLKELFVKSNDGVPVTNIEKNRIDPNFWPKSLACHFHVDLPGYSTTNKQSLDNLFSNWKKVYDSLWPNIKETSGKFPRGSVQNLYMLISLITDERTHPLADSLLGHGVRYKIKDFESFGDWFCKRETERMADINNWITDKNGDPVSRPVWSKRKGGLVEKPFKDPTKYQHATNREGTGDAIVIRQTSLLEDFVEYVNTTDSIGVITKIATKSVTNKLRKDIALKSDWKIDGEEVTYSTMMNGKFVHLDHSKPKSKGGTELTPMEAKKNILKSDTYTEA